jgi:NitT/TauT family transport system substrate-binding protein
MGYATRCGAPAIIGAIIGLAMAAAPSFAADTKPEKPHISLSVGGKPSFYYLPLTITERLGYFKDAGLDVEISDFAGGAKSLQALIGGSVDVTTGSYEHTIQMQAQGKSIVALVDLGMYPGIALGIAKSKAAAWKGPESLKGMKVGVSAPGSSTNFMVSYIMTKAGMRPEEASFISVGTGPSSVAAMKHGDLDAISEPEPIISQLESTGDIVVVADSRTAEGTKEIYGGSYPAAVLYANTEFVKANPKTMQALVTAFVRGLKFVHSHTPEEIAAVMPEEYYLGDKANYMTALKKSMPVYSPDGRLAPDGPQNVLTVLSAFDPKLKEAKIDLAKTYDDRFVEAALKEVK